MKNYNILNSYLFSNPSHSSSFSSPGTKQIIKIEHKIFIQTKRPQLINNNKNKFFIKNVKTRLQIKYANSQNTENNSKPTYLPKTYLTSDSFTPHTFTSTLKYYQQNLTPHQKTL